MKQTLRPYQGQSLDAIVAALKAGMNRVLLKKPTGTGKTVTFAAMLQWPGIVQWLEQFAAQDRRMLVIAHREELLDQAADKIRRANPGLMVSIEQGSRVANRHSDVIIASIQTLQASKFRRMKALLRYWGQPRIVVVDEAHHAAAATYRTALVHLGFLPSEDASDEENIEAAIETDAAEMAKHLVQWDAISPKDRLLVGVTATPNRTDAIGLGCVFQTIAYNYALKDAIDDGYLVPIVPWVVETDVSLDNVRVNRGEFSQRDLADTVNNEKRNAQAVEAWHQYAAGRQTIAFTVDVAHAHDLAEAFVGAGVEARAVSGETPKDERRQILADFTRGRVQVICNCMILTEGTDLPTTSCILHAKPTKSATLYEQMTGRGLRVHPDDPAGPARVAQKTGFVKNDCIIIDVVDIARRHSLQTAPMLYGLPPNINPKGDELKTLEKKLEDFLAKYPGFDVAGMGRTSLEAMGVRASTFDIWKIPELGAIGQGLAMQWVKQGEDRFRLQYAWADGTEVIRIEPNVLGKFDISITLRPALPRSGGHLPPVLQRTLASGFEDARGALQVAESFIRQDRRSVVAMLRQDATWRERDASPKQIALLKRLGAPIRPGLTMGQASAMIDVANARRGR